MKNSELQTTEIIDPQIARPTESFKASFGRLLDSINFSSTGSFTDEERKSIEQKLWCWFSGNYVDVLCSMHGWKSCIESERKKSQQLFDSLVEMTNLYIEECNIRPKDVDPKEEEKYQRAIEVMRQSGLKPSQLDTNP